MNWRDIPLPERMKSMPTDKRGFPIPYVVAIDASGNPQFTVNDAVKQITAIHQQLCGICGQRMPQDDIWLVGGPKSAFHPHGAYIDGPLHGECARYALQVCPYLAISATYRPHIEVSKLQARFKDTAILIDPTVDPSRPPFFVMVRTEQITITPQGYLVPIRPHWAAEFWKGGEPMSREEATKQLLADNINIEGQILK
jgi:hypothetical protein